MVQPGPSQSFDAANYDSLMKNVLATHCPDGAKINLKPMLDVIDNTLSRANVSINEALLGKCDRINSGSQNISAGSYADTIDPFASIIRKISCELQCKCSGGDAHMSTMEILKDLRKYEWDAKVVIAIAAFAMNYGEFCLFAQLYLTHPLAKYVASLKNLPDIAEHGSTHQHLFGSIKGLTDAIVALAKVMDQFDDLNHKYVSPNKHPLSKAMAVIHEPAYWVILSVVVCIEQISSLAGVSTETTTSFTLANVTLKVNDVLKSMQEHLQACVDFIGEKTRQENYERIKKTIENAPSQEVVLQVIFNLEKAKLIHCTKLSDTLIKQDLKTFDDKIVLILTSGVNITSEEITFLVGFYEKWQKERQSEQPIEIIWLPMIKTGTSWKAKFDERRGLMPWYTVENPELIKQEVICYIEREWRYSGRTRLVALDSSGKVLSKNVLDQMWILGDSFSDFHEAEEIRPWEKYTNDLELLFGSTGHNIDFSKVVEGTTTVCFYGGKDIEWIKKFTEKVVKKSELKIELTYVGNSTDLDGTIQKVNELGIGNVWNESFSWLFWTRLRSILSSSIRIMSKVNITLIHELTTLLTLEDSTTGWAVFCGGSTKLAQTRGNFALTFLDNLTAEGVASQVQKLDPKENLKYCHHFIVDHEIQEEVQCACGLNMKKSYAYKCCHGDH